MADKRKIAPTWVELPGGIFTTDGVWFHTTEVDLRGFAPAVVERYGIERLTQDAYAWLQLPLSVSVLTLAALLLTLWAPLAAAVSVLVYVLLTVISPSVVFFDLIPFVRRLNHPILQGLIYVGVMSFLAATSHMIAVGVGLGGFIALRWRLVSRIVRPVSARLLNGLSPLDPADLILRNVLIRAALKHGYDVDQIPQMQARVLEIMNYRKKSTK